VKNRTKDYLVVTTASMPFHSFIHSIKQKTTQMLICVTLHWTANIKQSMKLYIVDGSILRSIDIFEQKQLGYKNTKLIGIQIAHQPELNAHQMIVACGQPVTTTTYR